MFNYIAHCACVEKDSPEMVFLAVTKLDVDQTQTARRTSPASTVIALIRARRSSVDATPSAVRITATTLHVRVWRVITAVRSTVVRDQSVQQTMIVHSNWLVVTRSAKIHVTAQRMLNAECTTIRRTACVHQVSLAMVEVACKVSVSTILY